MEEIEHLKSEDKRWSGGCGKGDVVPVLWGQERGLGSDWSTPVVVTPVWHYSTGCYLWEDRPGQWSSYSLLQPFLQTRLETSPHWERAQGRRRGLQQLAGPGTPHSDRHLFHGLCLHTYQYTNKLSSCICNGYKLRGAAHRQTQDQADRLKQEQSEQKELSQRGAVTSSDLDSFCPAPAL